MVIRFTDALDAALKYEALGFSVIPLRAKEKSPAIPWKEFCTRRATPDEIRNWFKKHPDWNVGIVCGAVSGVAVVDIDGPEGVAWFKENGLPVPPMWQTTSGPNKRHMFYKHPGKGFIVHPSVDTTVKVDVRGDGSQIVAAPSIHPSGKMYELHVSNGYTMETALQALPMMPGMFVSTPSDRLYTAPTSQAAKSTVKSGEEVVQGGRNDALTSQCGLWYSRGLQEEDVLLLASAWNASHCVPPMDDKEVETIVHSMANTHGSNNPGMLNTDGVHGWVARAKGEFCIADVYRDLSVVHPVDKAKVRQELDALIGQGVLEMAGSKDGVYRKRDHTLDVIDVNQGEGEELKMWLPFGLNASTIVYPGNVIVVAGETNSGKTSLLLNIVSRNWNRQFRYLSSEMTPQELRGRLAAFKIPVDQWLAHCTFIQRSDKFADAIDPDAINIVDYLEMTDDFYKAGKYITDIFKRLRKGVAIITVQKKRGEMFGRGGEFGLEKARLGISLFSHGHTPDGVFGSAVVTKAKNIRRNNPQDKEVFYRLRNGADYDMSPLGSCPSIRQGLSFYSAKERKQVLAEIENYCLAAQKPDEATSEEF